MVNITDADIEKMKTEILDVVKKNTKRDMELEYIFLNGNMTNKNNTPLFGYKNCIMTD